MMPTHYLSNESYRDLLTALTRAFTTAAHSTDHTLPDLMAEALAAAGVLPECCRDAGEIVQVGNVAA